MFFSKLKMFFPVIVVMALDMAFTLLCQPYEYWQHDYKLCNEANPIGQALLSFNPACFVMVFILYASLILYFVLKVRKPAGIVIIAPVFMAHAHGSASWLPKIFQNIFLFEASEPCLYFGYSLVIAMISIFCFRKPFAPSV